MTGPLLFTGMSERSDDKMPIAKVALLFVHRACLNEAVRLHVRGRLYQVTSEILHR